VLTAIPALQGLRDALGCYLVTEVDGQFEQRGELTGLPGVTRLYAGEGTFIVKEFEHEAEQLRTRMWKTSSTRFRAAQRLNLRERLSTFSIALLSVVAIAVGLLDPHTKAGLHDFGVSTAAVMAILSVFILVISLIEASGQTSVRADRLHSNAVRIAELRAQLESLVANCKANNTPDWTRVQAIGEEYSAKIRECPFNHELIDYRRFAVDHRFSPEFMIDKESGKKVPRIGPAEALWTKVYYLVCTSWLSVLSWLIVLMLLVVAFDWPSLASEPRV
jgi:hypothetical protein